MASEDEPKESSPPREQLRKASLPSIESLFGLRRDDNLDVILDEVQLRRGSAGSIGGLGTINASRSGELQSSLPGSSLGFGGRRGSEMSTSGTELPYRRSHLIYDRTGATSPGANSSTESTSKAVSSRRSLRRDSNVSPRSRVGSPSSGAHSPLMRSSPAMTSSSSVTTLPLAGYLHPFDHSPVETSTPRTTSESLGRSLTASGTSRSYYSPYALSPSTSNSRLRMIQEPLPPPPGVPFFRTTLLSSNDAHRRRHTISAGYAESSALTSQPRTPTTPEDSSSSTSTLHSSLASYQLPSFSSERPPISHSGLAPPPSTSRTHPSLLAFASEIAPPYRRPRSPQVTRPSTSPSTTRPSHFAEASDRAPPSSFPRRMSSAVVISNTASPTSSSYRGLPSSTFVTQLSFPPSSSASSSAVRPGSATSSSDREDRLGPSSGIMYVQTIPSSGSSGGTAGTAKYECPYCPKRFNRPSSLKIHVNTHTGEKPFKCPFPGCGRRFSVMSNMRRHSRVHSQARPNERETLSGMKGPDAEEIEDETEEESNDSAILRRGSGSSTSSFSTRRPINPSQPSPSRPSRLGQNSHPHISTPSAPHATDMISPPHYRHSSPPMGPRTMLVPVAPDTLSAGAHQLFNAERKGNYSGEASPHRHSSTGDKRSAPFRRQDGAKRTKSRRTSSSSDERPKTQDEE